MAQPSEKIADPLDQWEVGAKYPIDASAFARRCANITLLVMR